MRVYNTLTRQKEDFKPIKDNYISMYVCGPTVYDYIHVGNARPMVVFDTFRRYFLYKGYEMDFVVNFTDIDDKIIARANERGVSAKDIAERYIEEFKKDVSGLNILDEHTKHPKATEFIGPMIKFIEKLIEMDAAYNVDGNVYFDISKAQDYGKLSKKTLEDLLAGARVDVSTDKKSPADFALWKKAKADEPYWESPWGKGRPGWHIECSVMSKVLLGDTIDIHAGGSDLQFPHHENEIAQSETLSGKTFANYWLHNGMLTIDNQKMSKSLGNFFTVREIGQEYDLEILRFFLLSAQYRNPINFSRDIMDQMKSGLDRLYTGKNYLEEILKSSEGVNLSEEVKRSIDGYKEAFLKGMDDDLNTADGISSLFEIVKYTNSNLTEASSRADIEYSYETLMELAGVLGILYKTKEAELLEEDIQRLIEERTRARENKDFQLADKIRDDLLLRGIILEDSKGGVKWKKA